MVFNTGAALLDAIVLAVVSKEEEGRTHKAASAILQSVKSRPMEIRIVEMIEPASSGIKCEKLCSRKVQSAIMVLVRSAKSFFPKKERGILRRCSARVIRRTPLSL